MFAQNHLGLSLWTEFSSCLMASLDLTFACGNFESCSGQGEG